MTEKYHRSIVIVSHFLVLITVNILWPVANVYPGVEKETYWARHQDWSSSSTLVVEAAVIGMRYKDSVAILTLMADDIKISRSLDPIRSRF